MSVKSSVTCPGAGCGQEVHLSPCRNCRNNSWVVKDSVDGGRYVYCASCGAMADDVKCPSCGTRTDAARAFVGGCVVPIMGMLALAMVAVLWAP